jgi:hypothetical protein
MHCQQIDNILWDFCDANLSPDLIKEVKAHLLECKICRYKVSLTLLENEVIRDENYISPPHDFSQSVMQELGKRFPEGIPHTQQAQARKKILTRLSPKVLASAAMVAVLLLVCMIPARGYLDRLTLIADNQGTRNSDLLPQSDPLNSSSSNNEKAPEGACGFDNMAMMKASPNEQEISAKQEPLSSHLEEPPVGSNDYHFADSSAGTSEISIYSTPTNNLDSDAPQILTLHPEGLPDYYKLAMVTSLSDNSISFSYIDTRSDQELKLTITSATRQISSSPVGVEPQGRGKSSESADSETLRSQKLVADSVLDSAPDSTLALDSTLESTQVSTITWRITLADENVCIASLSAPLTPEELNQLADLIILREAEL